MLSSRPARVLRTASQSPNGAATEPAAPTKLSWRDALVSARDTKVLLLGSDLLYRISDTFRQQFPEARAVVVADRATFIVAGQEIATALRGAGLEAAPPFVFDDPHLHAEHHFVETLEHALRAHTAIPVAVGSGTLNDLVKLAAYRVGRPYLCVATAASMDGYTAFGASITYRGAKQTFHCPAPRAVIADIEVIRRAPPALTAAGYADLQAKITAGADWLLADALGVEPLDLRAWTIVQGGLRDALADPAGARNGQAESILALTEGLMLGGFAMQWTQSSRPASGAEHQFSHLWDMEHHVHQGESPAHGFKVGVATLAIAALYEHLLQQPLDQLDVAACCARWPRPEAVEAEIRREFADSDFVETAVEETLVKHCTPAELREQLGRLRSVWPALREQLCAQLLPRAELEARLRIVGAPTSPEAIGLSRERLRRSFRRAYHLRRRFTVLDLAMRTGLLEPSLDALFSAPGIRAWHGSAGQQNARGPG